jgi:hypothetical protein
VVALVGVAARFKEMAGIGHRGGVETSLLP